MNINHQHIDSLGGLVATEIELNTPELPEVYEKEVTFYLFDGFGIAKHEDIYLEMTYVKLQDAADDEQIRRHINAYRFGNRLEDDFEMTVDDLAVCYGEVSIISKEEYAAQLIEGLKIKAGVIACGTAYPVSDIQSKLDEIAKSACGHLHIYKDEGDFLEALDGKVYAVNDENGQYLCDILQDDLLRLEEGKKVYGPSCNDSLNDMSIYSSADREYVLSQRIEILILTKKTKQ